MNKPLKRSSMRLHLEAYYAAVYFYHKKRQRDASFFACNQIVIQIGLVLFGLVIAIMILLIGLDVVSRTQADSLILNKTFLFALVAIAIAVYLLLFGGFNRRLNEKIRASRDIAPMSNFRMEIVNYLCLVFFGVINLIYVFK